LKSGISSYGMGMQVIVKEVAGLMGIDCSKPMPHVTNCPLCSAKELEIRHPWHIVCRNCHFSGDIVTLYSTHKKEELQSSIAYLKSRALLDLGKDEEKYVKSTKNQLGWRKFILEKAEMLRDPPASFTGVLGKFNCRFSLMTPQALAPHIIPLFRKDLENMPLETTLDGDSILRWWNNYIAVAIPCYDGVDLLGFWLITQRGAKYLQVVSRDAPANGFGLLPSIRDDVNFVISDPLLALRLTLWSASNAGAPTGFVVPYGLRDTAETYRTRATVFWDYDDDTSWFIRATGTPAAHVLTTSQLPQSFDKEVNFPCGGSYQQFVNSVRLGAKPAHQALALHLLKLPRSKAKADLIGITMESAEKAKCIAYVTGEDAKQLSLLLNAQTSTQTIDWSGSTVSETPNGWVCKGKVISSAMFYLDTVRPIPGSGGNAVITGQVVYGGKSYDFEEQYNVIRVNPAKWLESFIVMKVGHLIYVDKAWRHRLFDISQKFKQPAAIMEGQRYGWDGELMRMPYFIVDSKDVYASYETIDGPKMLLPVPLSDAERDNFGNEAFCRMFMAILGNAVLTYGDKPGHGFLMVNEGHILSRYSQVFGIDPLHNPTETKIGITQTEPLFVPVTYSTEYLKTIINRQVIPNLLVNVDIKTARLAELFTDWSVLNIGSNIDFSAIRGVFFALQKILVKPLPKVGTTFYRELARTVQTDYCGTANALMTAATDLDGIAQEKSHSLSSRLLSYIVRAAQDGTLGHQEITDGAIDGVQVRIKDFYALLGETVVAVPAKSEITGAFIKDKFLVSSDTEDTWTFGRSAWDFYSSINKFTVKV